VAVKVGVSSQALYKYFPNSGALRAAIAATLAAEVDFKRNWKPAPGTTQEFVPFLQQMTKNYRAWLRVNHLNPKLFRVVYGATSFSNGHETPVLLERLETFLHIATNSKVAPKDAFEIWGITADRMTSTAALELPEDYDSEFRASLRKATAGTEQEFPLIQEFLKSPDSQAIESEQYYDLMNEALLLGLAELYNLPEPETTPSEPSLEGGPLE